MGGYMTYMPDFHAPFVFANFNGTSGDVDVITHECGHAFQGYLTADDPILEHADITMETAETHSMSMEFFTNPWMDLFFGDRADDFKRSRWRMPLPLSHMAVWWMNSSISYTIIRK
ncbi:MAG: M3 family metallopeptidase [Lachnospiraceae bacterium]